MVRFGAMHSAPIFRPWLSGLGRLAALGSRLAAGVLAHPRLWGIGTCCRRSWGLTAASLGPLGPHVALWRWSRQRGRGHFAAPAACGCGLPARLPPGGGWVSCQKPYPFHCAARVGFHALIAHAGVRVDAFVLALACFASTTQLLLRMHANLAQGRAGLEPAGGLSAAPHDGRGSPPPV